MRNGFVPIKLKVVTASITSSVISFSVFGVPFLMLLAFCMTNV